MKDKLIRITNNAKFQLQKHSPELLLAAGLVGTVVGTVCACKATIKAKSVLDEHKTTIDKIHEYNNIPAEQKKEEYTDKDYKKDLTIAYTQTGVKLFKLYMPAIGITAISFSSILKGHNVLVKRNVALAAAYTAIDKGFKKYRNNVIERFGENVDKELRYNVKEEAANEKDKSKDKKDSKSKKLNYDQMEYSDYARFFDATSSQFRKDPEYNLMFLKRQQDWANEKLKAQGHLFLNEVYDMLDIPQTRAGQVVGWIYDPEKNDKGDNYVDFGIYRNEEAANRFVNGMECNILLDFNVDGSIFNVLEE